MRRDEPGPPGPPTTPQPTPIGAVLDAWGKAHGVPHRDDRHDAADTEADEVRIPLTDEHPAAVAILEGMRVTGRDRCILCGGTPGAVVLWFPEPGEHPELAPIMEAAPEGGFRLISFGLCHLHLGDPAAMARAEATIREQAAATGCPPVEQLPPVSPGADPTWAGTIGDAEGHP